MVKFRLLPARLLVLPLILGLSFAFNAYFLTQRLLPPHLNVQSVIDGDTFVTDDGDRIRLLGIDAPEESRCLATASAAFLSDLILHQPLRIENERRDAYGRRMGFVYAGTTFINAEMLRMGLARPDYSADTETDDLKSAYHEATSQSLGIHGPECKITSGPPPDPKCAIKGNIDKATWKHYYHLPTCRHYNQIVLDTDLGEGFFCTEEEAKKAGFTLAPDCLR